MRGSCQRLNLRGGLGPQDLGYRDTDISPELGLERGPACHSTPGLPPTPHCETVMDKSSRPAHRCTGDFPAGVPGLLYFVEPLTGQKQTEVFVWGWTPALLGEPGGA